MFFEAKDDTKTLGFVINVTQFGQLATLSGTRWREQSWKKEEGEEANVVR